MTHNTTHNTQGTTTRKVLIANRLLKTGITHNLFAVVAMYARDMSDYEIVLDNEVEDFMIRSGGVA